MWLLLPWIAYMSLSIIVAIVSSIFQLVALSSYGASGGYIFLGVILVAGILGKSKFISSSTVKVGLILCQMG